MGLKHLIKILPLVALSRAQSFGDFGSAMEPDAAVTNTAEPVAAVTNTAEPVAAVTNTAEPELFTDASTTSANTTEDEIDEVVSAPIYSIEECNNWLTTLKKADLNDSKGLSEPEYHSFLSSIEDPPYIAAYFEQYNTFDQLPWMFRVVHKSLACHCQKLGMGEECCEGDNAEVLLNGLNTTVEASRASRTPEDEYKDLFCQQIAYVLTKSVPSPAPTGFPSLTPSKGPTTSPTPGPTTSPSESPTTGSPIKGPSTPPTVTPTITSTITSTIPQTQAFVEVQNVQPDPPPEEDEGMGIGGIIGIIIACLLALLAVIALVAYRKKLERDRLRAFAGTQAPEADLEAQPPGDELFAEPSPEPDNEPHDPAGEPEEDDESSAPSVWSEGDDEDQGEAKMHDVVDGDERQTAGSALAAMGAASTVAANLTRRQGSSSGGSNSSRQNDVV